MKNKRWKISSYVKDLAQIDGRLAFFRIKIIASVVVAVSRMKERKRRKKERNAADEWSAAIRLSSN